MIWPWDGWGKDKGDAIYVQITSMNKLFAPWISLMKDAKVAGIGQDSIFYSDTMQTRSWKIPSISIGIWNSKSQILNSNNIMIFSFNSRIPCD